MAGNSDAQQARGTTHSINRGDSPFQNTIKYGIFKTPQKKTKQQPKGENQKGKKENEVMSYLLERCFHRVDLLNRPRFQ